MTIKDKVLMVECDGCGEKFDASNYEDIKTRHPHYNLILDGIMGRTEKLTREECDSEKLILKKLESL